MSKPDSDKPSLLSRIDVYTVMLSLALVAIGLAIFLLSMELGRYEWDLKAGSAPRASWEGPTTRHVALVAAPAGGLDGFSVT